MDDFNRFELVHAPPPQEHPDLVPVLHQIRDAFLKLRKPGERFSLEFFLNMLDQQVLEAREHLLHADEVLRHNRIQEAKRCHEKALNEVADCFSVGWQAIAEEGRDPEAFIVNRLLTRVLARVQELHERDLVAGRTGYKPGVKT